jgi:hypothetical protein
MMHDCHAGIFTALPQSLLLAMLPMQNYVFMQYDDDHNVMQYDHCSSVKQDYFSTETLCPAVMQTGRHIVLYCSTIL